MTKLHPDVVRALRQYHAAGYSISSLIEWSGLSRACISAVVNRRTHRDVTDDPSLPALRKVQVGKPPPSAKPFQTNPALKAAMERIRRDAG